jgi:hypothetical protein
MHTELHRQVIEALKDDLREKPKQLTFKLDVVEATMTAITPYRNDKSDN